MRWHYGDRVELVATTDEYTILRPGDRGTVTRTDSLGTVHVRWDGGSRLGIIEDAGDIIRPCTTESRLETMRTTQTPAEALASRIYAVDSRLELRIYEDPAWPETQRHGIYLALAGIRNAEDKMASAAYWIRGDMERVERAITEQGSTYSSGITRNAADYDAAAELRGAHMASLAALLGEEEFAAWKAAKAAARKDLDAEGTDKS